MYKTTLWIRERGNAQYRLMNTITYGSRFTNTPNKDFSDPTNQWNAAIDIMQGWQQNGNKRDARFKIVQTNLAKPNDKPFTRQFGPGAH